jgi:hypothetical protein
MAAGALAPLELAAYLLAAAGIVAAIAICIIWIIADAVRWHRRIAQQWPSWLNAAIPQLEDSSTLLAADAKTPIAKLQQQRLQARLADVLTDADYQAIARTRSKLAILPLALSLLAAARHGPTIAAPPWRRRRRPREANKPIVDGEVHLRVTPPATPASPHSKPAPATSWSRNSPKSAGASTTRAACSRRRTGRRPNPRHRQGLRQTSR